MITVAAVIQKVILDSPLLEEGISEGLINLSALARKIKPQVEAELFKPVSESALLMALKRLSPKIQHKESEKKKTLKERGDLTVRSSLMEFTFLKSDTILENQKELLRRLENRRDNFITFTQGVYEITIIVNSDLEETVEDIFKKEKNVSRIPNLSAITIRLSPGTVNIPGIHYSILKQLAWKNINVVEVVSTFTEFTIILEKDQVDLTFSILLKFFSG
ncbi:MAG: aspartate kinase [bacterium]|nr:aspartate kinase [bacterium]